MINQRILPVVINQRILPVAYSDSFLVKCAAGYSDSFLVKCAAFIAFVQMIIVALNVDPAAYLLNNIVYNVVATVLVFAVAIVVAVAA